MRVHFSHSILLSVIFFVPSFALARVTAPAVNDRDAFCAGARNGEDCIDKNGNFLPTTDNTQTLGTSALRWSSVYGALFFGDGSNLTGIVSSATLNNYLLLTGGNLTGALGGTSVTATSFTATGGTGFSGNGGGLTGVPAASISAGTLGSTVIASSIAVSGVASGTYGTGATNHPSITVTGDGRITSASNVATIVSTGEITGIVQIANGGTALNSAGGTSNRVLRTSNGSTYAVGQVIGPDIAASTIAAASLNQSGANTNDVMTWSGSQWIPSAPAASGAALTSTQTWSGSNTLLSTTSIQGALYGVYESTTAFSVIGSSGAQTAWAGCTLADSTRTFITKNIGDNVNVEISANVRITGTNIVQVRLLVDGKLSQNIIAGGGGADGSMSGIATGSDNVMSAFGYFINLSSGTHSSCAGFYSNGTNVWGVGPAYTQGGFVIKTWSDRK